jgi:imidazoleglycerol-phosphate dehydratase / histidinol-phosphatase
MTVLFIDRDGCIIEEHFPSQQIDAFEKLSFLPGVIHALARLVRETDFRLVMVTNQDGLGTDSFPEESFWPYQDFVVKTLEKEGIRFDAIHIDRSFAHENLPTRKPGTGMLQQYFNGAYDLANSFVIGDRRSDVQLAQNLGAQAILIRSDWSEGHPGGDNPASWPEPIALKAGHWEEIYQFLSRPPRRAAHRRKTNETDVQIELNLDGTGQADIQTGLGFFDHMLHQLARHGGVDLKLHTQGDLHIDEHHSIEDTGIALGEAFALALGDKRGLARYGFCLPMDDVLAQVAIDFGGRPWIVWNADFKREKIGDMPTEMFFHFFKSFSDAARCNLNIQCSEGNEHHKIEAIFKAFAKAIKMALRREGQELPSTKGTL